MSATAAAPWYPDSPQLGEEPVEHGVWKRTGKFGLGDLDDKSLLRMHLRHVREIDDIEAGLSYERDPEKARRFHEANIAAIDAEAGLRLLLKRRYGATESGVDKHSSYWDDVPAPRPSYYLALQLDYGQWRLGEDSVLDFAPMEESYGRYVVMRFLGLHGAALIEERMAARSAA